MRRSWRRSRTASRNAPSCEVSGTTLSRLAVPGLDPGIHVSRQVAVHVDGRDKPGHDGVERKQKLILDLVSRRLHDRLPKGGVWGELLRQTFRAAADRDQPDSGELFLHLGLGDA